MNWHGIVSSFATGFNKMAFKAKNKSPEIYLVVGIGCGIAAVVTAVTATIKAQKVLEEHRENQIAIEQCSKGEVIVEGGYSMEDAANDTRTNNIQTGIKLVKLYGVPVLLTALSIFSQCKGYSTLKSWHKAAVLATIAAQNETRTILERAKEKYGPDAADELKYGLKSKKLKEKNEDGTTTEKKVLVAGPEEINALKGQMSPYAMLFDSTHPHYKNDMHADSMTIKGHMTIIQSKLHCLGHVSINDIRNEFGYPSITGGDDMGKVDDPQHKYSSIDNFDFAVKEIQLQQAGYPYAYIIDPGPVYNIRDLKTAYQYEYGIFPTRDKIPAECLVMS